MGNPSGKLRARPKHPEHGHKPPAPMTQEFRKVPQNVLFTGFGQVLGNVVALVGTILVARYLGVEGFGRFSFYFGIAIVFWFIGEAGLMNIFVRELSRLLQDPPQYIPCLQHFWGLLSLISLAALVAAGLALWLLPLEGDTRTVLGLLALSIALVFQALVMGSVIRAHEEMAFYSLGFFLQNLAALGGIVWATRADAGLVGIFAAYAASFLLLWGYFLVVVGWRYGLHRPAFDGKAWVFFLKESIPLGLGNIFRRTANYVDIFILRGLSTLTEIGLFSPAYRFVVALSSLAMVVCSPFLPVFARLAQRDEGQMAVGLEKGLLFLLVASIPLTIAFCVYGDHIITGFFGANFSQAGFGLKLLGLSLLATFPATLFLHLFTAVGAQHYWTYCTALCLGLHLLLGLVFAPAWGHLAAVAATLAAEVGLFALGWHLLGRLGFRFSLPRLAFRPLLAGAVSGGLLFCWPGQTLMEIIPRSLGSFTLYVLLLWTLGVFTFTGILDLFKDRRPAEEKG